MKSDVSFVRHDQIPPSPPPAREAGAIKWVRENLFSNWINAILTIAAIYFIVKIIIGVYPWFANGVWEGDGLADCRAALEGATGACFAILGERWNQLLFGISYPSDAYWRPLVAFLLLVPCAAPVLFAKLPRKLLIATLLYPFIAYWLIWGGTIISPIVGLIGFIAGYYAFLEGEKRSGFVLGLVAGVIAAVIVWRIGGFVRQRCRTSWPSKRSQAGIWGALCSREHGPWHDLCVPVVAAGYRLGTGSSVFDADHQRYLRSLY